MSFARVEVASRAQDKRAGVFPLYLAACWWPASTRLHLACARQRFEASGFLQGPRLAIGGCAGGEWGSWVVVDASLWNVLFRSSFDAVGWAVSGWSNEIRVQRNKSSQRTRSAAERPLQLNWLNPVDNISHGVNSAPLPPVFGISIKNIVGEKE